MAIEKIDASKQLKNYTPSGSTIFLPFGPYLNANPLSMSGYALCVTVDRMVTFVNCSLVANVPVTNNGSNYWTISVYRGGDSAIVWELNTSANSPGAILLTSSTFAYPTADESNKYLFIYCLKTGSPGTLTLFAPLFEVTL